MYHFVDGKVQKLPEMFNLQTTSSSGFSIGHKHQILILVIIALAVGGYFTYKAIKK